MSFGRARPNVLGLASVGRELTGTPRGSFSIPEVQPQADRIAIRCREGVHCVPLVSDSPNQAGSVRDDPVAVTPLGLPRVTLDEPGISPIRNRGGHIAFALKSRSSIRVTDCGSGVSNR